MRASLHSQQAASALSDASLASVRERAQDLVLNVKNRPTPPEDHAAQT